MTKTLITGANQGLGYHAAQRLMAVGHEVWVSARDAKSGTEAARTLGARFVHLDVTDDASAAAAAQIVADAGGLDVLINNAGISDRTPVAETTASVVVNVSSSVGSLAYASNPQGPYPELNLLAYPASKAALNMLTIQWARAHPRWRVNSADPGFTATNLNQYRGTQTLEEGTDAIVQLATVGPDGPTGIFSGRQGIV